LGSEPNIHLQQFALGHEPVDHSAPLSVRPLLGEKGHLSTGLLRLFVQRHLVAESRRRVRGPEASRARADDGNFLRSVYSRRYGVDGLGAVSFLAGDSRVVNARQLATVNRSKTPVRADARTDPVRLATAGLFAPLRISDERSRHAYHVRV